MQQVMICLDKFRAAIRAPQRRDRFTLQRDPVLMVVFERPADDTQSVLLVLDITPEQVAQWKEPADLEVRKRIAAGARNADILKPPSDRIHRLGEHSFLLPVRPDQ